MTTDELADRVEAGLRAGMGCCQDIQSEGYKYTSEENTITDALAALADYRKRVAALEAALEPWARHYKSYTEYCSEERWHGDFLDYLTMFTGSDNVDAYGEQSHSALLAGSEGGDGQR